MKSYVVFFLVLCLVVAGIPKPSLADAPKALDAQEKATVHSMGTPDLVRQRAGEMIRTAEKLDPASKNFFKKLEAQSPWLLEQKAGDDSVVPPPSWPANAPNTFGQQNTTHKDGGISTGGAVLITLGAVGLLCVGALAAWSAGGGGGSC